jgi:hypothetical protein
MSAFSVSAELANWISERATQVSDQPPSAYGQQLRVVINGACDVNQLDEAGKLVQQANYVGAISDAEAINLATLIQSRRPLSRHIGPGYAARIGRSSGRVLSRFVSRQRQRSPDRRASRDRRRMLGGSSALPDNLRHHYTEGQRAVLCVIAFKIKRYGFCDDPIDALAAQAGVGRTTVQTTLHEARLLGHITVTERPRRGEKNLTNIVRICSREWLAWVKRGPSAARFIGSNPVKMASTMKIIDLRKQESCNKKDSADPPRFGGSGSKGPD